MISVLTGAQLKEIFKGAQQNLLINKDYVDALNVFPVPDGDTGTNMGLTMTATVKEAFSKDTDDVQEIITAIAKGALKGARGNSGVILSQIFKGMSDVIAVTKPLNTKTFAKALQAGSNKAYDAVTVPKEGTILTVIRMIGDFAVKVSSRTVDFIEFFEKILDKGEKTLAETPKLLPVLAQAGVVDSGGQGLLFILRGMYNVLAGIPMQEVVEQKTNQQNVEVDSHDLENITFAYCTEFFIIHLKKHVTLADIDKLRDNLMKIGDCVLVIGDLEMVKVHVHTNNPDKALGYALSMGELFTPKIENMLEQNREIKKAKQAKRKKNGLVAISCGKGFKQIFTELGADNVLEGGQTMNPSVDSIINVVNDVYAENVFVLPNNKNIVLACEQAKSLVDCNLVIIPTVNVPQGISAAMSYDSNEDVDTVQDNMNFAAESVDCIQITHSVRDTEIDGFNLKSGDVIAIEKGIIAKGSNAGDVALDALKTKEKSNISTITLYYGDEVKEEEAATLRDKIEEEFEDSDVTAVFGGQNHYSYYISIE